MKEGKWESKVDVQIYNRQIENEEQLEEREKMY